MVVELDVHVLVGIHGAQSKTNVWDERGSWLTKCSKIYRMHQSIIFI